jgi:hypothetical protein
MRLKLLYAALLLIFVFSDIQAQDLGISAGYSSQEAYSLGWIKFNGNLSYNFGLTVSGNTGKERNSFDYSADFGLGYLLYEKFRLNGEISVNDKRKDGAENSITYVGAGILGGYLATENLELYAGYNSIWNARLGLRIMFSIPVKSK